MDKNIDLDFSNRPVFRFKFEAEAFLQQGGCPPFILDEYTDTWLTPTGENERVIRWVTATSWDTTGSLMIGKSEDITERWLNNQRLVYTAMTSQTHYANDGSTMIIGFRVDSENGIPVKIEERTRNGFPHFTVKFHYTNLTAGQAVFNLVAETIRDGWSRINWRRIAKDAQFLGMEIPKNVYYKILHEEPETMRAELSLDGAEIRFTQNGKTIFVFNNKGFIEPLVEEYTTLTPEQEEEMRKFTQNGYDEPDKYDTF